MHDYLIIDTNNLYARAYYVAKKDLIKSQEVINATVLLTLKMILNLKKEYLSDSGIVYVLADNPTSKLSLRKKLDDQYKANRIKEDDGYYRGIDYVLLLCSYYSEQFITSRIKRMEADDLVPAIIKTLPSFSKILLVSADMDWSAHMTPEIDWLDRNTLYTQESFKKRYKFTPNINTVTLFKSLMGCTSDNIPAIKDVTEQMALNIITHFKDVFDLLDNIQKNTEDSYKLSDFTKKVILSNKTRLITNHNLVFFNEICDSEIKQSMTKSAFNPKALQILYKALNFPVNFDNRIESESISFGDIFSFDEVNRK